jgi:flagellar hook-associated protein 3 FlgL
MRLTVPANAIGVQLSQSVQALRARISEVSQEAVTGRHADLAQHLSGEIGEAMTRAHALNSLTLEREQLNLRALRLDVSARSLSEVHAQTLGLDLRMAAALGTGDAAQQDLAARDAHAALKAVFTALNVRQGDRSLFAGDATATTPLANVDVFLADLGALAAAAASPAAFETARADYFAAPGGGWYQNVYGGTPGAADSDAVTGADPALTELVAGLGVLALSGRSDGAPLFLAEDEIVQAAAARLSQGRDALTRLRADRGIVQADVAGRLAALDGEETLLTEALNTLTARDPYAAATELRLIETQLEASYLLTARLSGLSLLNYLR